jgi:peptidyl carrier protein
MRIEDRIRRFILVDLNWRGDPEELSDHYPLIDNDVIDSLGIFETVGYLEDVEGIQVSDEDLVPENFATIRAIASLVASKNGG